MNYACTTVPKAVSRRDLAFPKLNDLETFKKRLPFEQIKASWIFSRKKGDGMPLYVYTFTVDTNGSVINGNIHQYKVYKEPESKFFQSYIDSEFSHYNWQPAMYLNSKRKIPSLIQLEIAELSDKQEFTATLRLQFLPGNENFNDIHEEKDLIYKFNFKQVMTN